MCKFNKIKFCECGCGQIVKKRFVSGHNSRVFPNNKKGRIPWNAGTGRKSLPPQKCLCGCGKMANPGRKYIHGHNNHKSSWNKGIPTSEETKQKMKANRKPRVDYKHSEATKKKMSENHADFTGRKYSEETKQKMRKPKKEGHREAVRRAVILQWKNMSIEEKNARVKKALTFQSPNKKEIFLQNLLNDLYPSEWKFVGDGQVIIAGKCPDFININGQKKIIEFFGDYWHQGCDPENRKAIFREFGYDTLIIWEHELQEIKNVKIKIQEFYERTPK